MNISDLLAELRSRDIHVWADNGQLKVNALAGSLTPELRKAMQEKKSEILEFLQTPVEPSFAQQRLWFLDKIEMVNTTYLIPFATRITGKLDVDALEQAICSLVARHDALRMTFPDLEGGPVQKVGAAAPIPLPVIDISDKPESLRSLMKQEISKGLDLAHGPLFKAFLYRLEPEKHVLLLLQHHIISDAWSLRLIMTELGHLYDAAVGSAQSNLPMLSLQYPDYSRWQRERLQGPLLDRQLEYWGSTLEGAKLELDLPADRQRPAMETHRGANYGFSITNDLTDGLSTLGRSEGVTLFMLLLAAFDVLLWSYTGQEDLLVGVPVANRDRKEFEGLVGLFVNTLVVRSDLSGDPTVVELLNRVRERCLDAYSHQELPVEMIVEHLGPPRDLSRNPLFQVMLVLENKSQKPSFRARGLSSVNLVVDRGATHVDLTLYIEESEAGINGIFEYATDYFDETTIARMSGHFRSILNAMVSSPESRISELTLLTDDERDLLLNQWNATEHEFPRSACLHRLMEQQASQIPNKVAVICDGIKLTYSELVASSNRYARALRARGIGRGQHVGVCLDRSNDMLVAVLGILKAGAAYVPLDPSFPRERLGFMAADAKISLLVSTTNLAPLFELPIESQLLLDSEEGHLNSQSGQPLELHDELDARPEDPAYLIYTSGSTGKPKGVVVPHRAVVNFLASMARTPGLSEDDVLVAVTTLSFDISVLELQLPLAVGATLVIARREEAADGVSLRNLIEEHGANVLQATPVTWRLLLEAGWIGGAKFKALVGGETLPRDLADQLIANEVELWNMFGPTETTVWSTCACISDASAGITIGTPIDNTKIYVLDPHNRLCPVGVPGELCIGGDGVTLGYWERPELTAAMFVQNPFGKGTADIIYRTGDKARWLANGTLQHLGRLDDQVKVRGYRVELGEIEARIVEHPDVSEVAARLWVVSEDDVRIVACCVPEVPGQLATIALRKHLRSCLPEYMIPQYFLPVDEIPLTPNGKVDRRNLPIPLSTDTSVNQYEAPNGLVERQIAEIWTELIQPARPIGRADKFFEMGGHSLLALRALRKMEKKLGTGLDFRVLFQQNLADIAARFSSDTHSLVSNENLSS